MRTREEITAEVGNSVLEEMGGYYTDLLLLEVLLDIRELLQRSENRIGDFVRDFPDLQRLNQR